MTLSFYQHMILTTARCLCIIHAKPHRLREEIRQKLSLPQSVKKVEMTDQERIAVPLPPMLWSCPVTTMLASSFCSSRWRRGIKPSWKKVADCRPLKRVGCFQPSILQHQVQKRQQSARASPDDSLEQEPHWHPSSWISWWMQPTSLCISQPPYASATKQLSKSKRILGFQSIFKVLF